MKEKERTTLMMIEQPTSPDFKSSVRSTLVSNQRYLVDDITEATPCMLHVPVGKGDFTVETAMGQAIPGCVFHNQDIPAGYSKVQVDLVQSLLMKHKLDINTPKSIEILDKAVGNFILWPKWDIIFSHQKS